VGHNRTQNKKTEKHLEIRRQRQDFFVCALPARYPERLNAV